MVDSWCRYIAIYKFNGKILLYCLMLMSHMYIAMFWLIPPAIVVAGGCAYLIYSMIRADKI